MTKLFRKNIISLFILLLLQPNANGNNLSLQKEKLPAIAYLKHRAHAEEGTSATMFSRKVKPGVELRILYPGKEPVTIFQSKRGFIFDMNPSYDADKLLFAYKKNNSSPYHIHEINIDGSGLRQLTFGNHHDVSPVYLPDGRITFISSRVESFSVCQDFLASALYVMDADGKKIKRIEYSTLCSTSPYILDDGSILFSRWEYQDKNIFMVQTVWTINPDGTRLKLFYGNTLTIPNVVYNAKEIPGTKKLLGIMSAHHFPPVGAVCIIDRQKGIENVRGITNITPEIPYRPRKATKWNHKKPNRFWKPGDKFHAWTYTDPWPIDDKSFLVSYGGPHNGTKEKYRLFLMDYKGNKTLIHEEERLSCYNPIPLIKRPLSHIIPDMVKNNRKKGFGTFFIQDVYRGLLKSGVKRGDVKNIRIMKVIPKKYNTEGQRYHDHYPIIGQGTYYVKYNLGTVPIREDGSAYFNVPSGEEIYFQALDASGKEIRRMGTVTQIQDGEVQSCIGCHEHRFTSPERKKISINKSPDNITPPSWGAGPIDYVKQVQPVLDKYCIKCHGRNKPKAGIDLTGDKTRYYSMSYRTLADRNLIEYYYINLAPTGNFQPLESGSYVSRITKLIESKHHKVNMDEESRRRIYSWIDANVPYYSTYDMSRPYTTGGRDTWSRIKDDDNIYPKDVYFGKKINRLELMPWMDEVIKIIKKKNIIKPGEGDSKYNYYTDKLNPGWINLSYPEYSLLLRQYLSISAGGIKQDMDALFKTKDDPDYITLLNAIKEGKKELLKRPRIDMPNAKPLPQERNFGRTF